MGETSALNLHQLPHSVQKLVRALGMERAMRLLSQRGGVRLCVPMSAERSEVLMPIIGRAGIESLIQVYGGGATLTLPMADSILIQARNTQIRAEHEEGESLMRLAGRYNLSSRHIQNIVRESAEAASTSRQASLF